MKTTVTKRPVGIWLALATVLYGIDQSVLHTGLTEEAWGRITVAVGIVLSAISPRF